MSVIDFTTNSPNDAIVSLKSFFVSCGFSIIKDITDDYDIATKTFVDGKLLVLRDSISKYYILIRSANGYNIWGNSYTVNEDKINKTDVCGIGILMSPEYDEKASIWCEQPKAPICTHNGYTFNYGVNINMDTSLKTSIHCCYTSKDEAYTCLISYNLESSSNLKYLDSIFNHVIFGNLKIYNTSNNSKNEYGGFMLSTDACVNGITDTYVHREHVNGGCLEETRNVETAEIPQPNHVDSYYTKSGDDHHYGLFSEKNIGYIHVEYGEYYSDKYLINISKADSNITGNYWASSFMGSIDGSVSPTAINVLVALFPLGTLLVNKTATSLLTMVDTSDGNVNNCMYDSKSFGMPIISSILCNPTVLHEVSAVGEIYGLYLISTYNYGPLTYHAIKTYDGLTAVQTFPIKQRRLMKYNGIAINDENAKKLLGSNYGGDKGL